MGHQTQGIVIGAGISGIAAARELRSKNIDVLLVEKGRGTGGRLSARRSAQGIFNLGAQTVSASHPAWLDALKQSGARQIKSGGGWQHPDGMSAIARNLIRKDELAPRLLFESKVVRVQRIRDAWEIELGTGERIHAEFVVLTAPLPQALELVKQSGILLGEANSDLNEIRYESCLCALVQTEPTSTQELQHSSRVQVFFQGHPDSSTLKNWVLQANPELSQKLWLSSDDEISQQFACELAIDQPVDLISVHRWKYSRPQQLCSPPGREIAPGFWLAGDAFGVGTAESAFLSGLEIARKVIPENGR